MGEGEQWQWQESAEGGEGTAAQFILWDNLCAAVNSNNCATATGLQMRLNSCTTAAAQRCQRSLTHSGSVAALSAQVQRQHRKLTITKQLLSTTKQQEVCRCHCLSPSLSLSLPLSPFLSLFAWQVQLLCLVLSSPTLLLSLAAALRFHSRIRGHLRLAYSSASSSLSSSPSALT